MAPATGRIELLVIPPKGIGSVNRNRMRRRVKSAVLAIARAKGVREAVIAIRADRSMLTMRWQEMLEAIDRYVPYTESDQ